MYESKPFAQSHPSQIGAIARLFGLQPAALANARVLEIGCASGGNIIPLAANYPGMQVVGVELSPKQAAVGQELIAAMRLPNIQIITGDIGQYATLLKGHAPFDYILCHGVFTWIPEPVQEAILEVCNKLMAPQGVAYISYNTYPGWKLREVLREMMLFHAGPIDDPTRRLQQGRAIVEYIRNISDKNTAFGKLLATESEIVLKGSDYYIHHEFLEQDNRPLFFKDFMAMAMRHDLIYLGEANFAEMAPQRLGAEIAETLARLSNGNVLATEQYMDLFTNRFFRQTLLVKNRETPPISRNLTPASFEGLHMTVGVSALAPELQADKTMPLASYRDRFGRTLSVNLPLTKYVIDELMLAQPKPLSFTELVNRVVTKTVTVPPSDLAPAMQQIGAQLLQLLVQGALTVHSDELMPAATALAPDSLLKAFQPAQALAARGENWVPTRTHQAQGLQVVELGMIALMDGTRTQAQLIEAMLEGFATGRYTAQQDGKPITDREAQRGALTQFVTQALPNLQRHGLM